MKKQLGKKAHVQEGTMTAFACDCISVCQSSAFCNCTSAATQSNTYAASMGKIVATALSGSNYMWGQFRVVSFTVTGSNFIAVSHLQTKEIQYGVK